jgi:drug/metabolite transporter (DMT)-like permease
MNPAAKAVVAALVTVVLWASAFPFIRVGLRSFDPIALASLRFAVAAMLMIAWLAWKRPALPSFRDGLRLAACGALGITGYNVLLNLGQRTVPASAASFIVNTVPIMTALLALVLLRERLRLWAWVGTVISFAGIIVIALGQPGELRFAGGALLVFGAALCMAGFFTLQRPLVAKYGAPLCAAMVVVLGALFLTPWLPAALGQAARAPGTGVLAVVYLGIFPAAIGYATWGVAQAYFGASRAANFLYLVPPISTGLALGIAAELPSAATLAGGVLAIAGVIVVNTRGRY